MDQRARDAMALFDAEEFERAERAWRALLRDYERRLGPDHPDTIGTCNELGSTLFRLRRFAESAEMHREAHRRASKAHADTLGTVKSLGVALFMFGDARRSRETLESAYQTAAKSFGPSDPLVEEIAQNLAIVRRNL